MSEGASGTTGADAGSSVATTQRSLPALMPYEKTVAQVDAGPSRLADRRRVRRVRLLLDDNFGFQVGYPTELGVSMVAGGGSGDSGSTDGSASSAFERAASAASKVEHAAVARPKKRARRESGERAMRAMVEQQRSEQGDDGENVTAKDVAFGSTAQGQSEDYEAARSAAANFGSLGFTRSRYGATVSMVARLSALNARAAPPRTRKKITVPLFGSASADRGLIGVKRPASSSSDAKRSWRGLVVSLDDVLAEQCLDILPSHIPTLLNNAPHPGPRAPLTLCNECQSIASLRCTYCFMRSCSQKCLQAHKMTSPACQGY